MATDPSPHFDFLLALRSLTLDAPNDPPAAAAPFAFHETHHRQNTDNSANQAADYGEDYSSLEAGGGVSPAKKGADGGEYASSFG